jgi:hypothetical protein
MICNYYNFEMKTENNLYALAGGVGRADLRFVG